MNPPTALLGLFAGGAVTALVQGAVDGPRWLLLLGLNATVLAVVDLLTRVSRAGIAPGLRTGRPRAFAPSVVHGVRAVHKAPGRTSGDPGRPGTTFACDITVVPEGLEPFRVKLLHPLDVREAGSKRSMAVEWDPGQPWRVMAAPHPPGEWVRRARQRDPADPPGRRMPARRPGAWALGIRSVTAAVLSALVPLGG
ncbi:hypothetical protein OG782_30305 [Streptomyces sp. NBC_00876]|uniref:hypothetical protein n=1 Tax=Streptomyces sp. NBC_00876 TaxID=2975853 RepID=UPI0038701DB8|nr:hypothetical protein OG782_30305 [Streptomyces sp. NBC_00876]